VTIEPEPVDIWADEAIPRWLRGKHWHPGATGWTNHGAEECAATIAGSPDLAGLRRALESWRARQ